MAAKARPRDSRLIDGLEAVPHKPFAGNVWRVVREGRDPLQCSASGGRWDNGRFDVLYTSRERDGAMAEMYFHLLRGQPVFPSQIRHRLYELELSLQRVVTLTMDDLAALGLDTARYGQLSYNERRQEYPRTQEIADVAYFLECDGLLVPNARWDCMNLVVFCDRLRPESMKVTCDQGPIDWTGWSKANKPRG
jgi:hypothetical protein